MNCDEWWLHTLSAIVIHRAEMQQNCSQLPAKKELKAVKTTTILSSISQIRHPNALITNTHLLQDTTWPFWIIHSACERVLNMSSYNALEIRKFANDSLSIPSY